MDQWITMNPEAGADFAAPVSETIPRGDGATDAGVSTNDDAATSNDTGGANDSGGADDTGSGSTDDAASAD
jgi:hypothetical protein